MSSRNSKPKRGIPPELMNVEFNPNDDGVDMNGGLHNGHGNDDDDDDQVEHRYGQPQRSYTYKDRPGSLRGDGYGGGGKARYNPVTNKATLAIQSHNYEPDESEVWRAYVAQVHFSNRGQWWTTGKKRSLKRWILTFAVGVIQAVVAVVCNAASRSMATRKFDYINDLLNPPLEEEEAVVSADDLVADSASDGAASSSSTFETGGGNMLKAFWSFVLIQVLMCFAASIFVYIGKYKKQKMNVRTTTALAYAKAIFIFNFSKQNS